MWMAGGRIPEDVIQAVLRAHDIVETVGRTVHLTKSGKYLKGLCPFHSEKTPSFTVTPEKGIFHCYGCGKSGSVIRFRMELEGYSFPEAVRIMAEEAGIPLPRGAGVPEEPTAAQLERQKLIEAHEYAAKFYHYLLQNTEHGREAKAYLKRRGMSDKLIDQFMIGYAPERGDLLTGFLDKRGYDLRLMEKGGLVASRSDGTGFFDRFRGRIMFPIRDREGRMIAFAGRILHDGQPKYLNSPDSLLFNKSRVLYNFHEARPEIRKSGRVVLFEGYMDVIRAWDAGVRNGVASMGTSFTEEHVAMLRRVADEAVICYDGDDAGQAAALKSAAMFENAGMPVKVVLLPGGLDPDEYIGKYGPESFVRDMVNQPVSAVKFKLIFLRKNHKLLEDEGRKDYVLEAVRMIAGLDSPAEREFYLKELSREFEFPLETLKQECFEIRAAAQKNRPAGDKLGNRWNNGRNETARPPVGRMPEPPGRHHIERTLLYWMMHDAEAAEYVHDKLGDAFQVEDHAAIAAYLYAYYAQGHEPDVTRFFSTLQDERLERTAASILSMETVPPCTSDNLDAFAEEVLKRQRLTALKERVEERIRAERAGDALRAAQIAIEINTLERQLRGKATRPS
ncbi:DNA primase, catalytic core [Thermobacillus composti KWC4]|uniref:DNA primase n=2 Tax=Thermobacillus TaxID=76632 RepID=L0EDW1_THECK|nr:DNA primase, catalytic core [Thermobacillus composti KWC4]